MMSESSRNPETFKQILKRLIQTPEDFSPDDVEEAFRHLCQSGGTGASEAQTGAFLTALALSGLDTIPAIVAACASVLREHAVQLSDLLKVNHDDPEDDEWDYRKTDKLGGGYTGLVDIVGTGGDGSDSFNVSTTAAVVVAGTGLRVAKHGSKAATSTSGSADILLALQCSLTFPPSTIPTLITHSPFLFLFAAHYHPSLAHIAPIRRQLGIRTVFNVLGPLINPTRPQRMVLGVAKKELGVTFSQVLKMLNVERAVVVCGKEGLDEVSPAGETWVWELKDGKITEGTLHPTRDFGLPVHPLSSVRGSTPELNALTFKSLLTPLEDSVPPPHLSSPPSVDSPSLPSILDFVLLQAAVLLKVAGRVETYKDGVEVARESINSGNAMNAFEEFRKWSKVAMTMNEMGDSFIEDDGGVAAKNGEVPPWLVRTASKIKLDEEEKNARRG